MRLDKYPDNLQRFVKLSDSLMEPQINYKRNISRDNYSVVLQHTSEKSTLNIEANYAHIKEKDLTLTSYDGKSIFECNNILNYVDTIDHEQYDIHSDIVTIANKQHTLKYSFGLGVGSRLKSAPDTRIVKINPWDYDKYLYIDIDKGILGSKVHDYTLVKNKDGVLQWDPSNEC